MKSPLLELKNYRVAINEKQIVNGIDLRIFTGEVHVILGPNGAGKSTLVSSLAGIPKTNVTCDKYVFNGRDYSRMPIHERANAGIFLSFQNPPAIEGIALADLIRTVQKKCKTKKDSILAFYDKLYQKMDIVGLTHHYAKRQFNVGFSGGERKKVEALQLLMLKPKLAILDEIDSGLDMEATEKISRAISDYHSNENSLLIITHNLSILKHLNPDYIHILKDGRIVKTSDSRLLKEITENGFNFDD